ncbi:unnamed protein product [Phyllotreta striolata]|uniref:UDP-glucuronosyltransferase n=1 Tax=Phyllotreta striolata TaxID=444603 RepID=A0A9N9TFX9_PHYSR|nr:unnamed protein product [Phyllotreta striolata]
MKALFSALIILYALSGIQTLKILSVFSFCAYSHYTLGSKISEELANRGHSVTFINCFPKGERIKNLKEISVDGCKPKVAEFVLKLEEFGKYSYLGQLDFVNKLGLVYTDEVFKIEEVKKLVNSNEKFDVIIMEHFLNDAMAVFQHVFDSPLIYLAPGPMTMLNNHLVGNIAPPSFVPNLLTDYNTKMNFWQRLRNTYYHIVGELFVNFKLLPAHNKLMKKHFPDAPELSTLASNGSLVLLSTHVSMSDPVPLQQNIVPIGGYHVSPPKPLPGNIKRFLDESKEGVVLFSMGSNLKSSNFKPETRRALLNAFSKIKQKVLWKFETDLPEKPDNVMIMDWLPQNDVMAHPNVVAFISHGGLLGCTEAVYHGVPILGLPVFWDQVKNIEDGVRNGFALKLNLNDLTEESFTKTLNEILNNPSYRINAKQRSRIMRDRPVKQMDEAIFWIEYVARHKGALHLQSEAIHLRWYQIYYVDIILFISAILASLITLLNIFKNLLFRSTANKIKTN